LAPTGESRAGGRGDVRPRLRSVDKFLGKRPAP